MTVAESTKAPVDFSDGEQDEGWWNQIDHWMQRAGERLNPIVVKEARQSLKSRQFVSTFTLLLLCGWIWSLLAISLNRNELSLGRAGLNTFVGYFIILCVPLLIVVPYSTFQSLASERQEGTFEMLSITTLSAGSIVRGKLASAVLQMMIYYSALAPCLAFTYLLRGIDVVTIVLALFYVFLASLTFSCFGLLIASLSRYSAMQVSLSAMFVAMLVIAMWIGIAISMQMVIFGRLPANDLEFWSINLCLISALLSFCVLFVATAAAQINFPSVNRATPLRIIMLAQQTLLIGWVGYFARLYTDELENIMIAVAFAGMYWGVMGALMTGETGELSPRARRALPSTALGRVTLTWFNPGSATGYVFAVCNMAALAILVTVCQLFIPFGSPFEHPVLFAWTLTAYLALYLGVGRLLIELMRRSRVITVQYALIIQVFIAFAGALFPMVVQMLVFWNEDYGVLQVTNWVWTLGLLSYSGSTSAFALHTNVLIVMLAGGIVFAINLATAVADVAQVREATPLRVRIEEQQGHAAAHV